MEHILLKQNLPCNNETSITTSTALRSSRPPLREINNVATTASRETARTKVAPRDQHYSRSVGIQMPKQSNNKAVSLTQQHSRQLAHQKTLDASTSQTRFNKPYSLSNFASKSHLPHRSSIPSDPLPIPGSLRCTSDPSLSTVSHHRSTQTRPRAIPKGLPNPKAAPPDSDIASLWSEVHAHVSTMSDPTATSQMPSVTGTQMTDDNSQFESTLESFKVELERELHPQLCTVVSLIEAPSVSRKLAKQIKTGANASAYMVALNLTFFQQPEMPEKTIHDPSNRMNAPSVGQLVLDFQCFSDDNPRIAGILFVLAADDTWNDKIPLEYPSLLQGAGLWSPIFSCSDFLAVIGLSEASYKMESLRKTWGDRAKKALTKQLSIRRADANEDKWEILTNTRYYGYLITGMQLEMWEMRYNLQDPSPASKSQPPSAKPRSQSEPGTKSQRKGDTANVKQGISGIPKLNQKSQPLGGKKSSIPSNRSVGHDNSKIQDLPFTQILVKALDLRSEKDIVQFSEFHQALMRWAQAGYCAQYVTNLHKRIWQKRQEYENGNVWFMSNAETYRYWTSATAPEPVSGLQTTDPAVGGITSPERAGVAATKAWGAKSSGSTEGRAE